MSEPTTQREHRWSGWPGAYCLDCREEDRTEMAIGLGLLDPYSKTWKSEEARELYRQGPCEVATGEQI